MVQGTPEHWSCGQSQVLMETLSLTFEGEVSLQKQTDTVAKDQALGHQVNCTSSQAPAKSYLSIAQAVTLYIPSTTLHALLQGEST